MTVAFCTSLVLY